MATQDNLNSQQFTDVYHATDPNRAKSIMASKSFRGNNVYGSNVSSSPYMEEFGEARVHLRVPTSMVHPDGAEADERDSLHELGWNTAFSNDEHHYRLNAKDVKPQHIVGATGLDAWG